MLSVMHYVGMLLAIAVVLAVSILSGRAVKDKADFDSGGGKAGSLVVAGSIIGTLVGGSSTVGTAQLAYTYGLSAWWFTLGSGISCLLLALFYVKPYRSAQHNTIMGIIRAEYGRKMEVVSSLLSSIGIFISILAQLLSATAILSVMIPQITPGMSMLLVSVLMVVYVIFGGVLGTGMVGVVKMVLLYVAVISGGVLSLHLAGGLPVLYGSLDHARFFNLFARGIGTDAGAGLSLIVGVLCSQSYFQAIRSGRTDRDATCGALISACLIPPIGAGGILIGLYMRLKEPVLTSAKMAFPQFVLENMPPFLAGIVFAALLITLIGTGAGLSLGISSVIQNDILIPLRKSAPKNSLLEARVLIVLLLALACILCACPIGDTILNFSFMSMGLRGAVVFLPLLFALTIPGRVSKKWAMAAALVGPCMVLLFRFLDCLPFDSLFIGMLAALILCLLGCLRTHRKP